MALISVTTGNLETPDLIMANLKNESDEDNGRTQNLKFVRK